MSRVCRRIRTILLVEGPRGLQSDAAAQEHLTECEECFDCLENQAALLSQLPELPLVEAPDELVARVLNQVATEIDEVGVMAVDSRQRLLDRMTSRSRELAQRVSAEWEGLSKPRRRVWLSLTGVAATGLVASFLLTSLDLGRAKSVAFAPPASVDLENGFRKETTEAVEGESSVATSEVSQQLRTLGYLGGSEADGASDSVSLPAEAHAQADAPASPFAAAVPPPARRPPPSPLTSQELSPMPEPPVKHDGGDLSDSMALLKDQNAYVLVQKAKKLEQKRNSSESAGKVAELRSEVGADVGAERVEEMMFSLSDEDRRRSSHSGRLGELNERDAQEVGRNELERANQEVDAVRSIELPQSDRDRRLADEFGRPSDPANSGLDGTIDSETQQLARDFLAGGDGSTPPVVQQAEGYWSNAYVPGDPAFRLLQSRLQERGFDELNASSGSQLTLHEGSKKAAQPFDPPAKAAMALYLNADRRTVSETGRTMIQVGLQATDRRSGRRPALNLAVVLDLTDEQPLATNSALRALILEFAESRDLGDQFSLVIAGRPGGLIADAETFKYGPLSVALDQLFGLGGSPSKTLDLMQAMEAAIEVVAGADDPNAPLGSSVVLLVTPRTLGGQTIPLANLAHRSAVAGVSVGVVGVGPSINRGQLDRVALSGQGNRRLLASASEAEGLVGRVLSDVSRAVARALRLRIRLAPGVELVEVLGSQRLDQMRSEEVREAERSIDLRLARNLGIDADRGEDEEGIQIVIPSFYSGDSHVVLLDVLVTKPGPVADVTLRYKDLVHLRNGVSRAHLSFDRGTLPRGPLEVNVLKNQLAFRLFETLEQAGEMVAVGNHEDAQVQLQDYGRLLSGLRGEVPALASDPDLLSDRSMLAEYINLLGGEEASSESVQEQLVDSLRYAARLKILPQPTTGDD